MSEKDTILQTITDMKSKKPDGWKRNCRLLLKRLAYLEDPYAEHEDHGTEERGRRAHKSDNCPLYDDMVDDSWS